MLNDYFGIRLTAIMNINIGEINNDFSCFTSAWKMYLYEACIACLKRKEHDYNGTILTIITEETMYAELRWDDIFDDQIDRTHNEQNRATECGAECLAILLISKLSEFTIVKKTAGKNGFDYWLAKKDDVLFKEAARLEISGLFEGTNKMIDDRYNSKIKQTKISDYLKMPAYVVIIEFSNPKAKYGKRGN